MVPVNDTPQLDISGPTLVGSSASDKAIDETSVWILGSYSTNRAAWSGLTGHLRAVVQGTGSLVNPHVVHMLALGCDTP